MVNVKKRKGKKVYTSVDSSVDYFFLQKPKNPIFGVFLVIIPKMKFFQKSGSVIILLLRHPNFMRSFRKILSAVLEKTRLPTDKLTY